MTIAPRCPGPGGRVAVLTGGILILGRVDLPQRVKDG
jgi:hypothetical protein